MATPLQYSCLGNSMDREAWWATVDRVTKSETPVSTHTSVNGSDEFTVWILQGLWGPSWFVLRFLGR